MLGSSPLDQLSNSPRDRLPGSLSPANELLADVLAAAREPPDRALHLLAPARQLRAGVLAASRELLARASPALDDFVNELGGAIASRPGRPGRRLERPGDGHAQRVRQGLRL